VWGESSTEGSNPSLSAKKFNLVKFHDWLTEFSISGEDSNDTAG